MLIVLLTTIITLAAVVANVALRRVGEDGRRAEVLLLQLHGFAYRLSAFEWQAIGERELSSKIAAGAKNAQDEMNRIMGNLEQLDANAEDLRLVRQAYDAYKLAMDKEFSLIKAGNHRQAQIIDAELVDPAFDAFVQALSLTGASYRTRAKQMEQLAFFGSMLVLLLTIVTIGVLVWQIQKAQATTDAVAVEQRALTRGQEELRLFADSIPSMSVSFDENLRCLFANKQYADFFGFDAADIIGKRLREIVGERVYSEIEGHFAQVLQGRPVTYQRTLELKDGDPRYLEVRLRPHIGAQGKVLGCFGVLTDITEHKLTEERIQRMAHHDVLTRLPNRLLFNDRLHQAINLAKRDARQFALLYLDLDNFKPVNDRFGHAAGDELLQGVAARMRRQVRASDTVARIGGDEFTVILSDIARRENAETVARKIIAALGAPFQLSGTKQNVHIAASIGIAIYPENGQDADALASAADTAMYSAKQTGNSFRFFEA